MNKKSLVDKAKVYVIEHDGEMVNLGDEIERLTAEVHVLRENQRQADNARLNAYCSIYGQVASTFSKP